MNKDKAIKILTEICRILLGVGFIFSSLTKAIDPVGNAIQIEDYFGAFGMSAFNRLSVFLSVNMIALEFVFGVCLLAGVYRKITTWGLLIFMSFMTLLTLYLAIFNPVHDCGCFGEAIKLTNWQTFFKNIFFFLPCAVVVFIFRKRMTQFYTGKVHWFVALFAYLYIVIFSLWNYNHLPIEDFRPFKVGTNIPEAMAIPDDAEPDILDYIYEKDGKKQTFKLENLPDTTWTFVDTKLVKKGFEPSIISFELYDNDGNEVSDKILENEKGVFLLIAPRLEKASDKHIDEINNVYDYAVDSGMAFYCLTSSNEMARTSWINNTGAEYPFLEVDDITLKTIVRSNPGLILLKSGTILMKWHHNDIPSEEELNTIVNKLFDESAENNGKEKRFWILAIACFALPLLLGWIYDCLRNRLKHKKKENIN